MNPIDSVFAGLRERRRKAFIPFLTAGDPDIAATPALAQSLIESGADLLEVGFPYSDPIADGPVIQASYTRALDRGLRTDDVFAAGRRIAEQAGRTPLLAMVSFSLVHRQGPEAFVRKALENGFWGAVVPDLPLEESGAFTETAGRHDFKVVHLVTPTTSPERARQIAGRSTGFLYCVSVAGITGERASLPPELIDRLRWLRGQTALPLCVGFGVSTPGHVAMLRDHCDGVIVGSAVVRRLEGAGTVAELRQRLGELGRSLRQALDEQGG
jgi:tryptophan synthase alpha chain